MADSSFRVIPRGNGGCDVEMDKRNGRTQTVPGFRSEHEAHAWIVQARRMIRNAGPWTSRAPQKPVSKPISEVSNAPSSPLAEQKRLRETRNRAAIRRALVGATDKR
jgi:hypothetical protein